MNVISIPLKMRCLICDSTMLVTVHKPRTCKLCGSTGYFTNDATNLVGKSRNISEQLFFVCIPRVRNNQAAYMSRAEIIK